MDVIDRIKQELELLGFYSGDVITHAVAFVLFNSQAYRFNGDRVEITKANAAEAARWVAKEALRIAATLDNGEG